MHYKYNQYFFSYEKRQSSFYNRIEKGYLKKLFFLQNTAYDCTIENFCLDVFNE